MTDVSGSFPPQVIERRTDELYDSQLAHIHRRTDRLFYWLMLAQWAAGIVFAVWLSPRAWEGRDSAVHLHVWVALLLGGLNFAGPAIFVKLRPGEAVTRHVIAVAQMFFSALLIHLTGGRIETHFHVFGSLAFLALYRDWRVLLTASAVVYVDHFARGAFWPESVYGAAVASAWRALEHAGWVVFEVTVLVWTTAQSLNDIRGGAERQARVEAVNSAFQVELHGREQTEAALRDLSNALEERVRERTADLERAYESLSAEMTERRLAQEALEKSEEQLRHAQRMEAMGQLAGGVAHDFNNLLTVINGAAEMLLRTHGDDRAAKSLNQIRRAGDRAAGLTRQLLAFSRRQVMNTRVLDLNEVVADLDKMLRRLIGEHIDLVTKIDPELGRVKADPGQIEQVILNLVVNARDAMQNGGCLTVETANVMIDQAYARKRELMRPGPHVMIAVSDTGHGMDAETLTHIFEPFFTTKEIGKGTGLGLATVYGIIKQTGGSVSVYSEPGHGTTFKVFLPRAEGAVEPTTTGQMPALIAMGTETVLLVEDEDDVREFVREALEEAGYKVVEARDGLEAIAHLEEASLAVDVVVTDVVMPRMSGRELMEKLSRNRPGLKWIFMSGYTEDAIIHRGALGESATFLEKPFSAVALSRKVREVLDGRMGSAISA
jgi:signal transduction histidine kinase